MKRMIFLLIGAMMSSAFLAQNIHQGESALVYYSPKTTLVVELLYSVEKQEKGIYAPYAEELLGIKEVIESDQTTYSLNNVAFHTRTVADLSRPHVVPLDQSIPLQWLSINERGLLTGYNLPLQKKSTPRQRKKKENEKVSSPEALPILEDILEAKTIEEEAQLVAKHIFRLRETRMYLLSGEVEHAPADGTAMKLVLDELAKQEAQLTLLFTGQITSSKATKSIEVCPDAQTTPVKKDLLYFSTENGFTSAENIDAKPIQIRYSFQRQQLQAPVEETSTKKGKKGTELSPIVYNLPGYATINVRYNNEILGSKTIPVAQLGVDVPLAKDLFTDKELPIIVINEKTGNIESISK